MYHRGTNLSGIDYLLSLAAWTKERPFDLSGISKVLDLLGNPQNIVPAIIVGGTNGKGSVSAMISSILGEYGESVSLNISPHLETINERVVINGERVSDNDLSLVANEVKAASERVDERLSFHEAITVCAFILAKLHNVDIQVLEVGLGGRLDAANTVKNPIASVLVSVDYDHVAILGDTLEKIALEKVQIFRQGAVNVYGDLPLEAENAVKAFLAKKQIKSICYGKDFTTEPAGTENIFNGKERFGFCPALLGDHQIHNASLAIATCLELGIPSGVCSAGVKNVFWPGRLETVSFRGREIILDCSHNPAGIDSLISYFKSRSISGVELTFGVISSKDWRAMIGKLIPYVSKWNVCNVPDAVTVASDEVAGYLKEQGAEVKDFASDYTALLNAAEKTGLQAVFTGSIYLIGKLRSLLTGSERPIWRFCEANGGR